MGRATLLLALMLASGCGSPIDDAANVPKETESIAESPEQIRAFEYDQAAGVITLDPQIPPQQRQRFDIGQGSVTLETISANDSILTFRYTPEIEGGYTVYECNIPVSTGPITIKVNSDGTPGDTSFDLEDCRILKSGNVHWE